MNPTPPNKLDLCYVISPFADDDMELKEKIDYYYNKVILEVTKPHFANVERPQDSADTEVIINEVISKLVNADLVIADITKSNPNVMYELGVRHSAGKPTIIVTWDNNDKHPFDVQHFRIFRISRDKLGWETKACDVLASAISSAMKRTSVDSAVRRAILKRDNITAGYRVYDWTTSFLPGLHQKWLDELAKTNKYTPNELSLISRFRSNDHSTYPESRLLLDLGAEYEGYKDYSNRELHGLMLYKRTTVRNSPKSLESDQGRNVHGQVFFRFKGDMWLSVNIDGTEESNHSILKLTFYQPEREIELDKGYGKAVIKEFRFRLKFTSFTSDAEGWSYRLSSEMFHPDFLELPLGDVVLTSR